MADKKFFLLDGKKRNLEIYNLLSMNWIPTTNRRVGYRLSAIRTLHGDTTLHPGGLLAVVAVCGPV